MSCFICCVCVFYRFDFVKLLHWPGLSCERDLHLKGLNRGAIHTKSNMDLYK